jgi:hypothetical protein
MTVDKDLEDFELAVEQLEEADRLVRIDSALKHRRALILLDNLAEILTYRFCQRDPFGLAQVFPPKMSRSRWQKILDDYRERLNACYSKFDLLSKTDWAILQIGHLYRNASYHRDFHNKTTIAILARLIREADCRLFATFYSNGCLTGVESRDSTRFLAPYGLQGDAVDFRKASACVAHQLLNGENLDPHSVREALSADVRERVDQIIGARRRFSASMTDAEINDAMKRIDFCKKRAPQIDAIWQPYRKLNYLMMEVISEIHQPVSADGHYEAFEAGWRARTGEDPRDQLGHLDEIKLQCQREERLLFDALEGEHTWESLENIKMRGARLRNAQNLDACLHGYSDLDEKLYGIERCYEEATRAMEAAAEWQYELEAGK